MTFQFDILTTDLVVPGVREKIFAATQLPTVAMEPPRIFHYALGQQIKAHYDRCCDEVVLLWRRAAIKAVRIVTFLLYLNDDYDGGDLAFPKTGFKCRGVKGRCDLLRPCRRQQGSRIRLSAACRAGNHPRRKVGAVAVDS